MFFNTENESCTVSGQNEVLRQKFVCRMFIYNYFGPLQTANLHDNMSRMSIHSRKS